MSTFEAGVNTAEKQSCKMNEHHTDLVQYLNTNDKKKSQLKNCVNPQVHWMKGYLNCDIKVSRLAISKQTGVQLQINTAAHWQNMLIRSICFEEEK